MGGTSEQVVDLEHKPFHLKEVRLLLPWWDKATLGTHGT